jgi:membrane protein required for colicin V production
VNRIDVILTIVLILFALRGFWRGFSREFFGFIGLLGGVVVAAATYATAEDYLPTSVPDRLRPILAFAGVFFAVDLAANLVGALLHKLFGILFLSPVNRIAGAVFGAAKGAGLAAIGLLLVRAYTPSPALQEEMLASALAGPLLGLADEVEQEARPQAHRLEIPPELMEQRQGGES